ncbi:MAG TPA: MFS transporter [Burkholderiales bacterium]|nr:MFS transporter [Burkholderiales bacterium]
MSAIKLAIAWPARMKSTGRALRYRNFRLFFGGQLLAYTGMWIHQIALSWLVYRLTGSAFLLGLTGLASQIAILFFAPFGGIWADRFNRRRLLLVAQSIALILALSLAYLVSSGLAVVWHVLTIALLLGLVEALEKPVRHSFFVDLVERQDLANAIALNSFVFNAGRFLGPLLAGILLSAFGEVVCFLVTGLGCAAAMAALIEIRVPPRESTHHGSGLLPKLREGASYAMGFPPARTLLALVAAMSFTTTPYTVLMPIFAAEGFGGGAVTLGYLMGAAGAGALVAAVYLASRRSVHELAELSAFTAAIAGVSLMLFSYSTTLWFSLMLMALTGFGVMATAASCNTILQTIVPDDKRGRIVSFYLMAYLGVAPIGNLIAGMLAKQIGASHTLFIGGALCTAAAIVFCFKLSLMRNELRAMLMELGLIEPSRPTLK